jgi:hypothetical protein
MTAEACRRVVFAAIEAFLKHCIHDNAARQHWCAVVTRFPEWLELASPCAALYYTRGRLARGLE